jgi:hypothetical protein
MFYRNIEVRCSNDAHILLSELPNGQGLHYEIILGGWGNTYSALRKITEGPEVYEVMGEVCDPESYVQLSVSI